MRTVTRWSPSSPRQAWLEAHTPGTLSSTHWQVMSPVSDRVMTCTHGPEVRRPAKVFLAHTPGTLSSRHWQVSLAGLLPQA